MAAVPEKALSGIAGLDEILRGGFPRNYVYLVQGDPGAGKTTLAMQFLLEGARNGEPGVYLTLSESSQELQFVAASHGWSLDGITIYEQLVGEDLLRQERETTMFHPAEVELGKTVHALLDEVEKVKPKRVVLDSLSEIRLLSQSTLRYRKQILALKQYFASRNMTVLLLDDRTDSANDLQLHSVPHGVVMLERQAPIYGAARRRLEVVKLRGVGFRGGYHDFNIEKGGASAQVPGRFVSERRRGDRHASRRRARPREQHGDSRPGRSRQIDADHAVRRGCRASRRTRGHVHFR
jgi:circadian clock protein KaiC